MSARAVICLTMAAAASAAALAACGGSAPERTAPSGYDLAAGEQQAREARRPLVLLISDDATGTDATTAAFAQAVAGQPVMSAVVDLGVSANRAAMARFHLTTTPVLVCLSPDGIIVSRDAGAVGADPIGRRIAAAIADSADIDRQQTTLAAASDRATGDGAAAARRAYADFLLAHRNAAEAVPLLAAIAHDGQVPAPARVRAWVDLAGAHQWIGEPEKARHEAQALIAALGGQFPAAVAGGQLALGRLDVAGGRAAKGEAEFQAAIAAAPGSDYAQQAAEAVGAKP